MELDRVTIAQVVVSLIAVTLFVTGLLVISTIYGSETSGQTQISPTGGLALVALIAAFIIVMPMLGYLVERMKNDGDTG